MGRWYLTVFALFSLVVAPRLPLQAEALDPPADEAKPAALVINDGVIATSVENRLPLGTGEQFPAGVGRLYCFTTVSGAQSHTSISHTWYYQEKKMAEVVLPVRSANWRTWSSKMILPAWKGDWRVAVTDEDGILLKTIIFTVE